jgi:hypothetical protein
MKKKLIAILIVGMLSLTACTKIESVNDNKQNETSMFVEVETTVGWKIVYHKETKVMYAVSCGGYNCGNFTLLVNADGSPMLWKE